MGNSRFSKYLLPKLLHTEEVTSASLQQRRYNTGSKSTGSELGWRKAGHQGLLQTVGEVLVPHWSATACLSWAAPNQ